MYRVVVLKKDGSFVSKNLSTLEECYQFILETGNYKRYRIKDLKTEKIVDKEDRKLIGERGDM